MSLLNILEQLRDKVLNIKYDIGPMVFNNKLYIDNMELSQLYIDNLMASRNTLIDIVNNLDSKLKYAISKYHAQLPEVNKMLKKINVSEMEERTNMDIKMPHDLYDESMCAELNKVIKTIKNDTELIMITPHTGLRAIIVQSIDEVKPNGQVYYIQPINHFAFILAGKLFHGNIGTIYINEKSPYKVRTCRFGKECLDKNKCSYYHNPLTSYEKCTDIRNFTNKSFIYGAERKFGSRTNIDLDLPKVDHTQMNEFFDTAVHEMLCAVLLHQNKS